MKAKLDLSQAESRRAFTLVEMLVVIGMIAALAGISFPVYNNIQKKVAKQQDEMLINSLEGAIDNFVTEYNYLPYWQAVYPSGVDAGSYDDNGHKIITVLMGLGNTCNFKGIQFFTTSKEAKDNKNGIVISGTDAYLYDRWGNAYGFRMDYNQAGVIPSPYSGALLISGLNSLILTKGADGLWYRWESTEYDEVLNWDWDGSYYILFSVFQPHHLLSLILPQSLKICLRIKESIFLTVI
jgi:prepilin-type N-terminal cleavage/methylation domain-containing protein